MGEDGQDRSAVIEINRSAELSSNYSQNRCAEWRRWRHQAAFNPNLAQEKNHRIYLTFIIRYVSACLGKYQELI